MENLISKFKSITTQSKNIIKKIILILIIFNVLIAIFMGLIPLDGIAKTIVVLLIAIVQILFLLKIFLVIKNQKDEKKENFEVKYDPLLTYFLKNQSIENVEKIENLIYSELMDLSRRGYVEIIKNNDDEIYKLKEKDKFTRMNGLENIDKKQIEMYSTVDIPAYENLFVTKILFPFSDEISRRDISKKVKEGYYKERMELCSFVMEKMVVYFLEKNNMIIAENSINMFVVILSINIIVTLFEFLMIGSFNILLIISNIMIIVLTAILLKNEKIFSYKFSNDVDIYIKELTQYLNDVDNTKEDSSIQAEIMKQLFK